MGPVRDSEAVVPTVMQRLPYNEDPDVCKPEVTGRIQGPAGGLVKSHQEANEESDFKEGPPSSHLIHYLENNREV